jgi:hypothetical protein
VPTALPLLADGVLGYSSARGAGAPLLKPRVEAEAVRVQDEAPDGQGLAEAGPGGRMPLEALHELLMVPQGALMGGDGLPPRRGPCLHSRTSSPHDGTGAAACDDGIVILLRGLHGREGVL